MVFRYHCPSTDDLWVRRIGPRHRGNEMAQRRDLGRRAWVLCDDIKRSHSPKPRSLRSICQGPVLASFCDVSGFRVLKTAGHSYRQLPYSVVIGKANRGNGPHDRPCQRALPKGLFEEPISGRFAVEERSAARDTAHYLTRLGIVALSQISFHQLFRKPCIHCLWHNVKST